LENRKFEMLYDDLPPLFQDVVVIARKLGIDYIWFVFFYTSHTVC
jgi:hypothetical protein